MAAAKNSDEDMNEDIYDESGAGGIMLPGHGKKMPAFHYFRHFDDVLDNSCLE